MQSISIEAGQCVSTDNYRPPLQQRQQLEIYFEACTNITLDNVINEATMTYKFLCAVLIWLLEVV